MRAYVITTGLIFFLITLVHVWRGVEESADVARDPGFVLATLVAAALGVWAWRLLRVPMRS